MKRMFCLLLSAVMILGLLSGCGTGADAPQKTQHETQDSVDELEFDAILQSVRVVVDGIVHTFDVHVSGEMWYLSGKDAQAAFGSNFTEEYVELDAYARSADIRYEQDTILNAAYFSTYEPYDGLTADDTDFERAIALGLVSEELRGRKNKQISTSEFRAMLADLIERLAPDQMSYFDENVTNYDEPMRRGSGFIMAYYAAECIGADFFNNDFDHTRADGGDFWEASPEEFSQLYPHVGEGPAFCGGVENPEGEQWDNTLTAAFLWSFWHSSPGSGELMFSFDEEAGSMHQKEPLTVEDAVCAVTRLYDTIVASDDMGYADVDSSDVLNPSSGILTSQLLANANEAPSVTAENHPHWTGFVIGTVYDRRLVDESEKIQKIADWGFNSVRLILDYETIFNYDATQASPMKLELLDKAVAAAIQNNMHLNICFSTIPGRTSYLFPDHTSAGEFDLFTNQEKQEMAYRMWETLAQRYKEIPSDYLSFTPVWEADNYNLSTGLPYSEYTMADAGQYIANVTDRIRAQDADRLMVLEIITLFDNRMAEIKAVQEVIGNRENIIYDFNFVEDEYVYANMTATEGEHIDVNNHSFFLVDYPTMDYALSPFVIDMKSPVAYRIERNINWDEPEEKNLTLEGCLPAGTTIEMYLGQTYGGEISFVADGVPIYQETLEHAAYERSELLSWYIRYATAEKKIQVTLAEDVTELVISCDGGAFEWTGMDVILPDEYAQERWYLATDYDVFKGLAEEAGLARKRTSTVMVWPGIDSDTCNRITVVGETLGFKTDVINAEASSDTINATMKACAQAAPGSTVRFEDACFSAVIADGQLRYYTDLLSALNENGLSWWSNDWYGITAQRRIAEAEYEQYGGCVGELYVELLQLLQQYQNLDRS